MSNVYVQNIYECCHLAAVKIWIILDIWSFYTNSLVILIGSDATLLIQSEDGFILRKIPLSLLKLLRGHNWAHFAHRP